MNKADWCVVSRLIPYIRPYIWAVFFALLFLVLARVANVAVPILLKKIVDQLGGYASLLITVPLSMIVAYGLLRFSTVLFNELRNVVLSRCSIQVSNCLSAQVFSHLHKLSLSFHLDRKMGGLSRDIERGNKAVTVFLSIFIFNIVPVIIEISLVLFILWRQLEIEYVVVTMVMIVLYSLFTFIVTQWRTKFLVEMNQSHSTAGTQLIDSLINYETIKIFDNEDLELSHYKKQLKTWGNSNKRSLFSLAFLNIGQGIIVSTSLSILLLMAAKDVSNEILTVGDFVMINAFMFQLYIPLSFLGSVYREISHSLIDMRSMFFLLDENPDIIDRQNAQPLSLSFATVKFDEVSFSYGDNITIQDISFEVSSGSTLALVGPSGSGKSTLAKLLLRFYEVNQGAIMIDGQDIRSIKQKSLRRAIGVVPQDTVLFNNSIGYNIAYGHTNASQQQIQAAAKLANISDYIESMPDGYETLVGERGLKLSGGEKQRVAIARVILKNAPILIFDEATSSLDSHSEKQIQKALNEISKNHSVLVIAHRLSTITHADEIIVLDKGRIVERGNHQFLLNYDGLYSQMWVLQQKENTGIFSH